VAVKTWVSDKDYNYFVLGQSLEPYTSRKEHLDGTRLFYDFTCYLQPDETLVRVERALVSAVPPGVLPVPTISPGWRQDYPLGCVGPAGPLLGEDLYPLLVISWALINEGRGVEILIESGTPGFTYVMSFVAVSSSPDRHKQVDTLITIESVVNPRMLGPLEPAALGEVVAGVGSVITVPDANLDGAPSINLVSITLGAGDWNITGSVFFDTGVALNYWVQAGIGIATLAMPAAPFFMQLGPQGGYSGQWQGLTVPERRFYLSSVTTIYLVAAIKAGAGSTVTAQGQLNARNWGLVGTTFGV
jgi:hypothetical protein